MHKECIKLKTAFLESHLLCAKAFIDCDRIATIDTSVPFVNHAYDSKPFSLSLTIMPLSAMNLTLHRAFRNINAADIAHKKSLCNRAN